MKKRLSIIFAIVVLSLVLTIPVMAAYYINIDVEESNGTDYDMLAMNVSLDIDYLADNGYIDADGLDVRVQDSQGSDMPFMLANDKLMFASAIGADQTTGFQMTTGNTPLTDNHIVVGDGGYITVTDNANLELGVNFEIEFSGWVDTDQSLTLFEKTGVIKAETGGASDVSATIYRPDDLQVTTDDASFELCSGSTTRCGQRIDDFPQGTLTQLSFWVGKLGSPTGTAYVRCRRVSDDAIVGTFGSIDVTTMGSIKTWYDFTDDVYNPTNQDLRFTIEYDGGDPSNCIRPRYEYSDLEDGVWTTYSGSWSDISHDDSSFKLLFADVVLTATGISAGDIEVKVTGDGTDLKLYIDGAEKDTAPLEQGPDNSNNWVISNVPYMDYYNHTTSGTLRIDYDPDSIISGTTLPNEDNPGTYDGTITWGGNPAGISIETSGLLLDESYYYTGGDTSTTDIFAPEPAELAPGLDSDKLDHNPLSLGVEGFAAASNGAFSESLVWYGIAWFSVIAVAIALVILVREHLVFAATVSFALCIFWYVAGVFDYWVLIIFGIFFAATLIHERMPTW